MVSNRTRTAAAFAALLATCWGTEAMAQTTQKQWQLAKTGQGMELKLVEAPVRQPGANEVLIRMRAASLNRRDVAVTKGQYPMSSRATTSCRSRMAPVKSPRSALASRASRSVTASRRSSSRAGFPDGPR